MQKFIDLNEKEIINFLKSQGITVKTNTKARSHQGIYFNNRIDISTRTPKEKRLQTLIHEFAHKIHSDIEPDVTKAKSKGGSIEKLFGSENVLKIYEELIEVTNFVDKNSSYEILESERDKIKEQIKTCENRIKLHFPEFQRSKPFVYATSYFKNNKTDARFLLKHDRVMVVTPILRRKKFYDIKNIDEDFKEIPEPIRLYIKLKSWQKKQRAVSGRKNKFKKYYHKPTELFARLLEGLWIDCEKIYCIAPTACDKFFELLNGGYYGNLSKIFTKKEEEKCLLNQK